MRPPGEDGSPSPRLRRRRTRRNRIKAWAFSLTGSRPCPVCGGDPRPGGASWMHAYLRCRGCGLLRVAELPSAEDLRASYLRVHLSDYQVQHKRDWEPFVRHKQLTLERLGLALPAAGSGAMALDLGCGEGALLGLLQGLGWEAWGLELNPELARQARERGHQVACGSLEDPALPQGLPGSFDLVLMNHLIEHLRRPLDALERVHGLLRPGGQLLLETPLGPDLDNIDHLYCFSAAALELALLGCGFAPRRWFDYVDQNYGHHNLACRAQRV